MTFMSMFERWTHDWARALSAVWARLERFRGSPAGLQIEPLTRTHSSFHVSMFDFPRFGKVGCRTESSLDREREVVS